MIKNAKHKFARSMMILNGQKKMAARRILPQSNKIRLGDFIYKNTKQIVSEWEEFARTLTPAANDMTPLALRDHIHQILTFIEKDINSPQTNSEQVKKSHGEKEDEPIRSAAKIHAALRLSGGFDIDQMVSEFRALRASVIKLWSRKNTSMNDLDMQDLIRFNESIDQELAEAVGHYAKKVSYSKDLFIGILGHELRNPINAISMSSQLMLNTEMSNNRKIILAQQIFDSTERITRIVNDLLDVTKARLGSGLPIIQVPMDMGFIGRQIVEEMRTAYPKRTIRIKISGDLKGEWDKARIGQVFSNLIGNAIQYSFDDTIIDININGTPEEVVICVHNIGTPIPQEKIGIIFNSLTRGVTDERNANGVINLGLGLYITKDIVVSHGGNIDVTSTELEGTTFTIHFPRQYKKF